MPDLKTTPEILSLDQFHRDGYVILENFHGRPRKSLIGSEYHDYESRDPWKPGNPMMVHALFYPAGVSHGEGCLSVLPGSHRREVKRHYPSHPSQYGVDFLDGQIEITGKPGQSYSAPDSEPGLT